MVRRRTQRCRRVVLCMRLAPVPLPAENPIPQAVLPFAAALAVFFQPADHRLDRLGVPEAFRKSEFTCSPSPV
ncbi:hypothetical protein, partial [Hydrogenibacillus schlegelii]|uniref:hypothetical protein n=1 Tax=Hydrogenibacillus schlegelii TaxID=1484 RepID=UPI00349FEEEE